jgi:hypothetical protein
MGTKSATQRPGVVYFEFDGRKARPGHRRTKAKRLVVVPRPREEWPDECGEVVKMVTYVFVTPVGDYVDLEERIDQLDGETVVMGDLPTLQQQGETVEVEFKPGRYYDVLCVGYQADGTAAGVVAGGRIATDKRREKTPNPLTFDELKFLGLTFLGLSPEQGEQVRATVTPMTAWGAGGRLIMAGLEFGTTGDKPGETFGVIPNHLGHVEPYGGRDVQEILDFLNLKPAPTANAGGSTESPGEDLEDSAL